MLLTLCPTHVLCALDSVGMQCVLVDPSAHGGRLSGCDHENLLLNQQEIQPMEQTT